MATANHAFHISPIRARTIRENASQLAFSTTVRRLLAILTLLITLWFTRKALHHQSIVSPYGLIVDDGPNPDELHVHQLIERAPVRPNAVERDEIKRQAALLKLHHKDVLFTVPNGLAAKGILKSDMFHVDLVQVAWPPAQPGVPGSLIADCLTLLANHMLEKDKIMMTHFTSNTKTGFMVEIVQSDSAGPGAGGSGGTPNPQNSQPGSTISPPPDRFGIPQTPGFMISLGKNPPSISRVGLTGHADEYLEKPEKLVKSSPAGNIHEWIIDKGDETPYSVNIKDPLSRKITARTVAAILNKFSKYKAVENQKFIAEYSFELKDYKGFKVEILADPKITLTGTTANIPRKVLKAMYKELEAKHTSIQAGTTPTKVIFSSSTAKYVPFSVWVSSTSDRTLSGSTLSAAIETFCVYDPDRNRDYTREGTFESQRDAFRVTIANDNGGGKGGRGGGPPPASKPTIDLYAALGLTSSASQADIKTAWRRLVKVHHPDKHPNDPYSDQKFREVQLAYEVLSDPDKKRLYDKDGTITEKEKAARRDISVREPELLLPVNRRRGPMWRI